MNDTLDNAKPKKVFISYSWSSEKHREWVIDLAERLVSDGIDVVIDEWSLEDGHDIYAFMESMVNDPGIDRVIIISDAAYAAKANIRKGGVGTETQIISKEVFESVTQNKFIAVLKERDAENKALLPTYIGTRKYIDFSDPSIEDDGYESLIRNIHERPRRRKPTLGKAPSHIFVDDAVPLTCKHKTRRLKEVASTGRGSIASALDDFSDALTEDLEALRMAYERAQSETWCERLAENIKVLQIVRDQLVDVTNALLNSLNDEQASAMISELLERLMPFDNWPEGASSHTECSEDNYKVFLYEVFLYVMASCVRKKKFAVVRSIIDYRFLTTKRFGGGDTQISSYSAFNNHASSLEQCGGGDRQRRLSVMADKVFEGSKRSDIKFNDLQQADALLFLCKDSWGWFPRTLVYAREGNIMPLFARAVNEQGLAPLKTILEVSSGIELLKRIESDSVKRILSDEAFRWGRFSLNIFNLDELKDIYAGQKE